MTLETGYPIHGSHIDFDFYKTPEGDWLPCPCCGLKPKAWVFDNGRSTSCGCWEDNYHHFAIFAESIMSVHRRNKGNVAAYDSDGLRKNWNHWCKTGDVLFDRTSTKTIGLW